MAEHFHLFGAAHCTILLSVVGLGAALTAIQRRLKPGARSLRLTLGVLLAANTALYYWDLSRHGLLRFPNHLPFELCDASLYLALLCLLLGPRPLLYDLLYYFAVAGAGMALLTPNFVDPFPSLSTMLFFTSHGLLVSATLFLGWSGLARPRPGSAMRAFIGVNLWAVLAGTFNILFKTDYMFLCAKPPTPSLLDLLGPWPWYLLTTEGVAVVLFSLLYLPWRRRTLVRPAVPAD